MPKKFFFDTETTGVNRRDHELFDLSCIVEIDGIVKEETTFLCHPLHLDTVDPKALEVNGYTIEKLKQLPSQISLYVGFTNMMSKYIDRYNKKDKFLVYGYYVDFDMRFLRKLFNDVKDKFFGSWFFTPSIDVAGLAAEYLQVKRPNMQNFKLATVAQELGIKVDVEQTHTALYDAQLTKKIYDICK